MKKYLLFFFLINVLPAFSQSQRTKYPTNPNQLSVDFGYAFSTPHRLCVSLPENQNKTLVDAYTDEVCMKWSYGSVQDFPVGSFKAPQVDWELHIKPKLDGEDFGSSSWHRVGSWLPVFEQNFEDKNVRTIMQVAGGATAAIARIEIQNNSSEEHEISIQCKNPVDYTGYNPSWIQADWDNDVLLAGMNDRADRIIVFMMGGERQKASNPSTITQNWILKPGEKQFGWIIRPYKAYHSELSGLKINDWDNEFEQAKEAWYHLIERAAKVIIPDKKVEDAFYAGLADCFIMREPVADGRIAGTPGTEHYRAVSSGETAIAAILLDQAGLHYEAEYGFQTNLESQDINGNWNDPKGWAHLMWCISGFKSWAVMEHFYLTNDTSYLERVYPRMLASSIWQDKQRGKTRNLVNGEKTLTYGLMPRGMGDCGLMDGKDYFGIFLPHNIWAVYADYQTLSAAKILNKTEDSKQLQKIVEQANNDLVNTLNLGAIEEDGYRWIPGVAGKTDGSRWGALYAAYPCNILPRDHELINGTILKMESNISPGGIPVSTGWLKDGLWVAVALDNLAENLLYRDEGDAAIKYLYATLNHASPLYSWCEERGQESGSDNCTGDIQHLWTPLAVSRFLRDALVMEDGNTLHLARGIARQWFDNGETIGVSGMPTHFGEISYEMKYNEKKRKISGFINVATGFVPNMVLHIKLPDDRKIVSFSGFKNARIKEEGTALEISNIIGNVSFEISVN